VSAANKLQRAKEIPGTPGYKTKKFNPPE